MTDENTSYVVTNYLGEEISPRTDSKDAAFQWMQTKRPGNHPSGMSVSEVKA